MVANGTAVLNVIVAISVCFMRFRMYPHYTWGSFHLRIWVFFCTDTTKTCHCIVPSVALNSSYLIPGTRAIRPIASIPFNPKDTTNALSEAVSSPENCTVLSSSSVTVLIFIFTFNDPLRNCSLRNSMFLC